jgi:hypothetical protein
VSLAPTLAADSGLAPSVKTVVEEAVRAKKRRSRLVLVGGASLVVGVVVTGAFFARRNGPRMQAASASELPTASAPLERASAPTTPAFARGSATSPGPAASEPAPLASSASGLASASSPDASASARPVSAQGHPQPPVATHLPKPPSLACGPGEHASGGHCCAVGLEWQMDHCDRPFAKEVPF